MPVKDILYKVAFSFLKKKLNSETLNHLIDCGISAEDFFNMPSKELFAKSGLRHDHDFDKIAREEAVALARNELSLINNHNITPLFVLDEDYPSQLVETPDPPIVLYKLGNADLEADIMLSVVGTRKPTPYGIEFCNKAISEVACYFPEAVIVSGLAYGIDAAAHKQALDSNLTTVAVVAHGLNMIYPAANRGLAKEIIRKGGSIISEYPFGTKPFKPNFLARNRIVAALSDATVVVESDVKGGAMSTANYAFLYNRDVFALPGKTSDPLSAGCNLLIKKNKAHLVESVADILDVTGWQPFNVAISPNQRNLFPELDPEMTAVYETLKYAPEPMQIDTLAHKSGFNISKIMSLLSELEFDGIVMRLPGNRYTLA